MRADTAVMKVLVTAASKHGSNAEIAEVIAERLRTHALTVECTPPETVHRLDDYDAVILGSAIYMGHWMKPATAFVKRHAVELQQRPVWLFSSGAVVESKQTAEPGEPAVDMTELLEFTGAREHRLFGGRLERSELSFLERVAVKAAHAEDGDARDWDEVRSWADSIAAALGAAAAVSPVPEPDRVR
jgi:menaquinone-dependent protoporphyrinogen oxidase